MWQNTTVNISDFQAVTRPIKSAQASSGAHAGKPYK